MGHKFDIRIVEDYIKAKWTNACCPMCQSTHWNISDTIYEFRKFTNDSLMIAGGPVFPVIPLVCDDCGNTLFIHVNSVSVLNSQ